MLAGATTASYADDTLLKRLTKRIENPRGELAEFVEEEDPFTRHTHLAGSREARASTDQSRHRRRVMRRSKRRSTHEARRRQRQAGGAVDPRHRTGGIGIELGQQPRQSPSKHCLPRAGGPDEEEMVATRGRDFERKPGCVLPSHITEVELGRRRVDIESKIDVGPRQTLGNDVDDITKAVDGPHSFGEPERGDPSVDRADDDPRLVEHIDHRQDPPHWSNRAIEPELADRGHPFETLDRYLAAGAENAERNGKVEPRADFAKAARGEVDGHPLHRPFEFARLDRRSHTIASFATRCVGETDDREAGEPIGDVDLDRDTRAVDAVEGRGLNGGKQGGPPKIAFWRSPWSRRRA